MCEAYTRNVPLREKTQITGSVTYNSIKCDKFIVYINRVTPIFFFDTREALVYPIQKCSLVNKDQEGELMNFL